MAFDRKEYAQRPEVIERRNRLRRELRAKKKVEDPDYWRKEAASKESQQKAQAKYYQNNKEECKKRAKERRERAGDSCNTEHKRKYNLEYSRRPDVIERRKEYKKEWRLRKKLEKNPDYVAPEKLTPEEQLENKRKYNREYANRPDVIEKRREYRRQWRAKKKAEDPNYWKKEAGSKESQDKAQAKYREKNAEVLAKKARDNWNKKKEEKAIQKKEYRMNKLEENKNYWKDERAKDDIVKVKARSIANQFPIEEECEYCHSKQNLERHHPDYNKPEEFLTLCRPCHAREHRKY